MIRNVGLDLSPQQLAAQSPGDTVLLNIAVTDPGPGLAVEIAYAVSEQLAYTLAELYQVDD